MGAGDPCGALVILYDISCVDDVRETCWYRAYTGRPQRREA